MLFTFFTDVIPHSPLPQLHFVITLGFSLPMNRLIVFHTHLIPSFPVAKMLALSSKLSKYCDLNSLSQQIAGILCCNLTVLQRIYGRSVPSCKQHWQESLLRWWWLLHVGNQIVLRSFIKYMLVLISNVIATTAIQQGTFSPWYQEGDLESWEVGLQFCQQYTVCAVLFFFFFSITETKNNRSNRSVAWGQRWPSCSCGNSWDEGKGKSTQCTAMTNQGTNLEKWSVVA